MDFKVGDQGIHWSFGPGEIIQVDEKEVSGRKDFYYIVQTHNLTLWVPVNGSGEGSLRFLTPRSEFDQLFEILTSPGGGLPEDRLVRKTMLTERLRDGRLDSICKVVRDLNFLSRSKKLNEYDNAILERDKISLLDEGSLAWSIPVQQAEKELHDLLKDPAKAGHS